MPRWRFEAIGTAWEIETSEALSDSDRAAVTAQIAAFDADWSRFRPDSLVSHLARSGLPVPVPSDAIAMLDLYAALDDATEGAVNPLVGDSVVRLGYDPALTLRAGDPVAAPAETAMLADAAATALFFDGGPRFAAVHDVEWVLMTTAGAAEWSPGFAGELFT